MKSLICCLKESTRDGERQQMDRQKSKTLKAHTQDESERWKEEQHF